MAGALIRAAELAILAVERPDVSSLDARTATAHCFCASGDRECTGHPQFNIASRIRSHCTLLLSSQLLNTVAIRDLHADAFTSCRADKYPAARS